MIDPTSSRAGYAFQLTFLQQALKTVAQTGPLRARQTRFPEYVMDEGEIKELILSKQANGRIACKIALDIAHQAGVSSRKVGEVLNELNIKIRACQLGCFE